MPMIEFVGPDGDRVEQFHHTPVSEVVINGTVYKKAPIPSSIMFNLGASAPTQEQEVKQGLYAYEQSQKPWTLEWSKNKMKRIWGI